MANVTVVDIPYAPRNWAKKLHNTSTRWIWMCLHRRAGKSTGILNHLQRDAIKTPKSQYAFIGPTYRQTKRIAWEIAKEISAPIPGIEKNEVELTIKYPNGSKIFLAGAENIDSLRGISLWGGASDEDPWQNPMLFTTVISKCLADHLGYWIFSGTPLGKNHFYRRGEVAKKNPEEWTYIFQNIDESLKNEEGETIDNLRIALEDDRRLVEQGEMTQEEFEQEWYCSFEAAIRGAYYARELSQMRKDNRIKIVPYDKELPVHTVSDLGVGPAFATGFYQRVGKEMHMIDFWQGQEKDGIPDFVMMLQRKPYAYGSHWAPHDIMGTEIGTGQTRWTAAKNLGIEFKLIPSISVDDGIEKGRLLCSRLWIDEMHCEPFIDLLSQYRQRWDEKRQMFIQEPYHNFTSHAGDVHRYAAVVEGMIKNDGYKPIDQKPFESSAPYSNPKDEEEQEDTRPMRKPNSWGPKSRFQQSEFESSNPFNQD